MTFIIYIKNMFLKEFIIQNFWIIKQYSLLFLTSNLYIFYLCIK